jgi:predicted CXXCH cytochrome family protein
VIVLQETHRRRRLGATIALVGAVLLAACGITFVRPPWQQHGASLDADLKQALPRMNAASSFASSSQCRECHPQEYSSWHASYHRQMTQVAQPKSVLGTFDGAEVEEGGLIHRMIRQGEELWVETRPASSSGQPTTDLRPAEKRRVVMTTGAHHMQIYWAPSGTGNLLDELPVIFIRDERSGKSTWAPLEASYLSPSPPGLSSKTHWNTGCILCHATGGAPVLDEAGATNSRVAELGIACEACHGPGERHVRLNRERQGRADGDGRKDKHQAIINPAKLHPERASQVCGHCHALASFMTDELTADFFHSGSSYRPGDDLLQTRMTVLPAHMTPEQIEAHRQHNPFFDGSYWPDGMVRVAGREYNGLLESTCFQKAGMTCLSCHSMHQSDPNDQMATRMEGNEACYQCHTSYRQDVSAHTHHKADSNGSQCYNCHMPHTTYGLFKAIRSHQISSPKVSVSLANGRPMACNLCHLSETLAWAATKLSDWYQQPVPDLDEEQRSLSAAAVFLLKGDSVQRALLGWVAGWRPALECGSRTLGGQTDWEEVERDAAAGNHWLAPLLGQHLNDDSPVIRLIAWRSLSAIDKRYAIDYDIVAAEPQRAAAVQQIIDQWLQTPAAQRSMGGQRVLITSDGQLDQQRMEQLLESRDLSQLHVQE